MFDRHPSVPPTPPRSPNKDNPVSSKPRGGPPAWYGAGRRSSGASSSALSGIGDYWFDSGACGRSAWRDREIWMQSEHGLAERLYFTYVRGRPAKNAHPSEARLRGEAPQALPVEGVLNPINSSRFLHADRPDMHVYPRPFPSPQRGGSAGFAGRGGAEPQPSSAGLLPPFLGSPGLRLPVSLLPASSP
jgi:hypothetical protein